MLAAKSVTPVRLPALSRRAGGDVRVLVRALRRATYLSLLPQLPPGADGWPEESAAARGRRIAEWLASLPAAEQEERRRAWVDVTYAVVAEGLVEPKLSRDQIRALAEDADVVAEAILQFSGFVAPVAPAEGPALGEESTPIPAPAAPDAAA
jgi:hypothetical protein